MPPAGTLGRRWRARAPALLLGAVAAAMLFANLGDQCLWQDEAQTALIAGTILTHGVPLGHDGRNSFSQEGGRELGPGNLYVWHPWLVFYLLAGCFAVLGQNTFAARLPFALFGLATVLLTDRFATSLWRTRRAGLLAAAVLLLNVPFLLLARQCRYYAPEMFFALLALYGYWGLLERRRFAGTTFTLAAIALFHTHYMQYAALLATVFAHAALFRRDRLRALVVAVGVTVLVNAPWMIWFASLGQNLSAFVGTQGRAPEMLLLYGQKVARSVFPPLLLLLTPLAVWQSLRRPRGPGEPSPWSAPVLLAVFIVVTVAVTWLTSPAAFFRYLGPTLPVAGLLVAWLLDAVWRARRVAGAIAVAVILVALGWTWRMPDYLYEITHHYVGPVDGIVAYLRAHARPGDVIATTYEDLSLKFYTGLHVVGGLTGEDLAPARTADWIIIRHFCVSEQSVPVYEYLLANVPRERYRPEQPDAPDTPYENREEPDMHFFRPPPAPPVVVLRRLDDPARP